MTTIRDAGEGFPLRQAWRDARDVAKVRGRRWHSWTTVWRRWQDLALAVQLRARVGRHEAIKRLAQPASRDKGTISALEWVSPDERTLDFWADFGDGRALRAGDDCAGGRGIECHPRVGTVCIRKRPVNPMGYLGCLRAFWDLRLALCRQRVCLCRVSGGGQRETSVPQFGPRPGRGEALRICHHLGIALHFALPGNARAKGSEPTFASLSRVIDDRPEFAGANAGHAAARPPMATRSRFRWPWCNR